MSNPFQLFRKYQKGMLTFGAILALAIFGLAPALDYLGSGGRNAGGGGGGSAPETLVNWKGGSLTDQQLADFRSRHFFTRNFLGSLREEARKKSVRSTAPPLIGIASEDQGLDFANQSTLELMMQAEKAKQEGIEITDQTVDQYLLMASGGAVDPADYRRLIGGGMTVIAMKNHLKRELAALNFEYMLRSGLGGATLQEQLFSQMQRSPFASARPNPSPVESWIAFDRLSRKASCTVLALDVKDYLKEVPESPSSDSELRTIYEEGKDQYFDPSHSEPGFRIPAKASFGYFAVNRNDVLKREAAKFTDEEVQKTYDGLVEQKDKLVTEILAPKVEEAPGSDPDDSKSAQPDEKKDDSGASTPAEKETGESKTKDESEGKDDPDATTDETSDDPDAKDAGSEDNGDSCDFLPQDEEDIDKKPDPDESDKPETGKTDKPETGKIEAGKDDAKKTGNDSKGEDGKDTAKVEDDKPPAAKSAEELKPETRIKKLSEVEDAIRESMVEDEALRLEMDRIRQNILDKLSEYRYALDDWEDAERNGEKTAKPELPDYEQIADDNLVEYGHTKLMTQRELIASAGAGQETNTQSERRTLAIYGFDRLERATEFQARSSPLSGQDGRFIFWIKEKQDTAIPTFDECREKVVEYWRREQATEEAKSAAQAMCEEVKASKQTLKGAKGVEATEYGPFTWMSSSQFGSPPTVSSLFNLALTDEFMEKVFTNDLDDIDYALDRTKEKVIVFQVTEQENDEEILREQFFKSPMLGFQASQAENERVETIIRDYKLKMLKDMGIKWVK